MPFIFITHPITYDNLEFDLSMFTEKKIKVKIIIFVLNIYYKPLIINFIFIIIITNKNNT